MDKTEFSAAMTRRGCVSNGNDYCGVYMDVPFAATFLQGSQNNRTIFSLRVIFSKPPKHLYRELKKRMKDLAGLQKLNTMNNQFVTNVTIGRKQDFEAVFDRLMQEMVSASAALGYEVPAVCPICKQPECDAYVFISFAYQPVHAACVQDQIYNSRSKVQQNEQTGNYVLGIIGAILGGIVGTIPTILLVVFGGLISGWLCALIPLGAYYGYKLLNGKLNKTTLTIVIIVSLLMVPVTQYLVDLLWSVKEGYGLFTPADYWSIIMAYPGDFIPAFLQVLLFIGLGFLVVFRTVNSNNDTIWNQTAFSEASLQLMNPPADSTHTDPGRIEQRPDVTVTE